jgi:peptidoglycan/xylan/chitin deacetylase (PgdA/CDA1 family)
VKDVLLKTMAASGAFLPFRLANTRKALVLTYHRFSLKTENFAHSQRLFTQQMEYLARHYRVAPLSQLAACIRGDAPMQQRLAAVTIDDGYLDAYEVAFTVLRRMGLPATLFVVTGFVDKRCWIWTDKMRYLLKQVREQELNLNIDGNTLNIHLNGKDSWVAGASRINNLLKKMPDEQKEEEIRRIACLLNLELPDIPPEEFRPVNWDQAREMDRHGLAIESHTATHPMMTRIDAARVKQELTASRIRLEAELNRSARIFCYPNGACDDSVRKAVAEAGYACAVTTVPGFNERNTDSFALRRINAITDMPHFIQATSGFELFKNRLRA